MSTAFARPTSTRLPVGILYENPPAGPVPLDLVALRARALGQWELGAPPAAAPARCGREQRLDHERAQQTHARERDGIALRTQALAGSGEERPRPPTVVIAHRHAWLRDRLVRLRLDAGMNVACTTEESTEVVAALVVHQPDVVLLTDRIQGALGDELLARGHPLCPAAAFAVLVDNERDADRFVGAGVTAVYSHRLAPPELCAALGRLVAHEG